jgi:hypothetical protein
MEERDEGYTVWVRLLNNDGDEMFDYASGDTVDDAIASAEAKAAKRSGDDSFVMTDWGAA